MSDLDDNLDLNIGNNDLINFDGNEGGVLSEDLAIGTDNDNDQFLNFDDDSSKNGDSGMGTGGTNTDIPASTNADDTDNKSGEANPANEQDNDTNEAQEFTSNGSDTKPMDIDADIDADTDFLRDDSLHDAAEAQEDVDKPTTTDEPQSQGPEDSISTGNSNEALSTDMDKQGDNDANNVSKEEPKIKDELDSVNSSEYIANKLADDKQSTNDEGATKLEEVKVDTSKGKEEQTRPDGNDGMDMDDEIEEDLYDSENHIPQTHAIIMPSYSSWFNMRKIHTIERESLPEFFQTKHPSKSPKVYMNYRNFMVNSYRLNPNEFLTLTSVRRNLVGDVGTLMRVHRFLNKWGLINYQVKPQFKPGYSIEKLPNGESVGLPFTGDYHVKYDSPRGQFPFETFKLNSNKVDVEKLKQILQENNIEITQNDHDNNTLVNSEKKHTLEDDSNMTEQAKKQKTWSEEEIGKLVTGIKEHKNDWYKIAELVGKTPQECVLKFLQIPIEDKFNTLSKDDKILKLLKYSSNFPITGVDNPVLSTLAFVSQLVDSDVAKAASARASKVMDKVMEEKLVELQKEKANAENVKLENEKNDDVTKDTEGKSSENTNEENKSNNDGDMATESTDNKDKDETKPDVEMKDATEGKDVEKEEETTETSLENTDASKTEKNPADVKNGIDTEEDDYIKDAVVNTLGILGARSHLFATYEEREMNNLSATIVNHELSKIDLKLSKVEELEKIYERERKNLAKQQEDAFLDRLALSRSTIGITKKLEDAIALIESASKDKEDDKLKGINELLSEAKSLLFKPSKQRLAQVTNLKNAETAENTKSPSESIAENSTAANDDSLQPLSIKQPQSFQIWAP
jgi:SWI/SNF complex subunit SWI3